MIGDPTDIDGGKEDLASLEISSVDILGYIQVHKNGAIHSNKLHFSIQITQTVSYLCMSVTKKTP